MKNKITVHISKEIVELLRDAKEHGCYSQIKNALMLILPTTRLAYFGDNIVEGLGCHLSFKFIRSCGINFEKFQRNVKSVVNEIALEEINDFLESDSLLAKQFVENLKHTLFHNWADVNEYKMRLAKLGKLGSFFSSAFNWEETEEGYQYWYNVSQKFTKTLKIL